MARRAPFINRINHLQCCVCKLWRPKHSCYSVFNNEHVCHGCRIKNLDGNWDVKPRTRRATA